MLSLDKSSSLDATATGLTIGPGSSNLTKAGDYNGGSFGGQGGSKEDDFDPSTYGTYNQEIQTNNNLTYDNLTNFLGSGGAKDTNQEAKETKGGGAIILKSKLFQIFGFIDASGGPKNIDLQGLVSGGSGGFISIT